jgi:alkylation response protein AidB-like acyl-CoA dehydrogenase
VQLELATEKQSLIGRAAELARERFAPRAAGYDRAAAFPAEDFADLFAAGLNAPTVPEEHGGLGLGPLRGDAFTLWMMTKELAKADLSLARCWEGHANSLLLLDAVASEEQKARWFRGVVERGEKWVVWSGEPQARAPGETSRFGTTLTAVLSWTAPRCLPPALAARTGRSCWSTPRDRAAPGTPLRPRRC